MENYKKKLHKIVVSNDGWTYLLRNDGTEEGLGDLGVDVIIKQSKNMKTEQIKKDIIQSYTIKGVPASALPNLFKELNLNLDRFHEWMNGQTTIEINGETIYYVDDIEIFANNLPITY